MNFKDKNVWIHIVFIALIVIIAGVSAFRLYRWNKGTRNPEADIEQVDPSEFDTETMDMILPMDGSLRKGMRTMENLRSSVLETIPFRTKEGRTDWQRRLQRKRMQQFITVLSQILRSHVSMQNTTPPIPGITLIYIMW